MTNAEILSAIQSKFPGIQEIPQPEGQTRGAELYISVPAAQLVAVCQHLRFDPHSPTITPLLSPPSTGRPTTKLSITCSQRFICISS